MNILFLSRWFPYPPDNGSKIRVFNLLRQLSTQHQVDLISYYANEPSPEALEKLKPYCRRIETFPYRAFRPKRLKALLGTASARPRSVVDTFNQDLQRLILQTAKKTDYQLVIASEIDMAIYAKPLRGMAKLLEEVELASLYEQSLNAPTSAERFRRKLMWRKWSNYILHLRRQFDAFTVVSQQEKDIIEELTSHGDVKNEFSPIKIIPNGVSIEDYKGNFGQPIPDTLIFTGALTYSANYDAVENFLENIYPAIRQDYPEVELSITGSLEGVSLNELDKHPGVVFTGYLDDIRPSIAKSWASIVPLRLGGGTRLKILESLAIGTPVVATRKGAEGLDLKDGRDILLANSASDFAAQTLLLLKSNGLRKHLSLNGKKVVNDQYDWQIIGSQLNEFIDQVVAKKGNSESPSLAR